MRKCMCFSHDGFLTNAGYALVAQRSSEGLESLAVSERRGYLDKVGSVSALELERVIVSSDELIDSQYRRFHNGS